MFDGLFFCVQVNGVEMTGKTQGDAVSVLRNTPLGSTVSITVSRQEVEEEQDERFKVPRHLVSNNSNKVKNVTFSLKS